MTIHKRSYIIRTYPARTPALCLIQKGKWTWRWNPSPTDASTSKRSWCQNCMKHKFKIAYILESFIDIKVLHSFDYQIDDFIDR